MWSCKQAKITHGSRAPVVAQTIAFAEREETRQVKQSAFFPFRGVIYSRFGPTKANLLTVRGDADRAFGIASATVSRIRDSFSLFRCFWHHDGVVMQTGSNYSRARAPAVAQTIAFAERESRSLSTRTRE